MTDERPARDEQRPTRERPGTLHMGKIEPEQRRRRAAKNLRNRGHRGEAMHKPCSAYSDCRHPKHGRKP